MMLAAVIGQWRHTRQGGDFTPVERTQFGTLGQQGQRGDGTDTWNATQQVIFGTPDVRGFQTMAQVFIDLNNALVQPGNVRLQTLLQWLGGRRSEPQRLLNPIGNQLSASTDHVIEFAGLLVLERTCLRTNRVGKSAQHGSIDPISLG